MAFSNIKRRMSQLITGNRQVRQPDKYRDPRLDGFSGGFLLSEKESLTSKDLAPMAPSDIAALKIHMKAALWFCDVVLDSGSVVEVHATFFKESSQFYTIRWVFEEMRKVIKSYLNDGKYHNMVLKISKIANKTSVPETCGGVILMDSVTGLWDELCFPAGWFENDNDHLHLEAYLPARVDGAKYAFGLGYRMPAIILIHELAHLVSAAKWSTMVELARHPSLRADVAPEHKGIQDVTLAAYANPDSTHDNDLLDLAETVALAFNHPTDQGVLEAFGFLTPFLAALDNGSLGSLLNAESYAQYAWYHGMLYLDTMIDPLADPAFVEAETELLCLVEAFGLEAEVLSNLDESANPLKSAYVHDMLNNKSRAVYEAKRQQIVNLLNQPPRPIDPSNPMCYSPRGYTRCEDVPVRLGSMFPAPIRPWWRDEAVNYTSTPWSLYPERILQLGYDPVDLAQPDVLDIVRQYMTDCWVPAMQERREAAEEDDISLRGALLGEALSSEPSNMTLPTMVPLDQISLLNLDA